MKKFLLLVMFLINVRAVGADELPKPDRRWFTCNANTNCVIVRGVCSWSAANKDSASDAEKYFASMMPFVECAPDGYPEPPPAAVCQEQRCGIEVKAEKSSKRKSADLNRAETIQLAEQFIAAGGYIDSPADKTSI